MDPITRTVYSLYWPETRAAVEELWKGCHHEWYEAAYTKKQDGMHLPFLETWPRWSGTELGEGFPHRYPTNGASEAIDHLILPPGRLHVFEGDYEGYARIAEARGMEVVRHAREDFCGAAAYRQGDQFWVSEPSAIDGEHWPALAAWLKTMRHYNPEVRVFIDATYIGAVKKLEPLRLAEHPNVAAAVFSLSKSFGAYYHRIGGVVSRAEIKTLWGNLWFKNLFSIHLGIELMRRHAVDELPRKYAQAQTKAVAGLIADGVLPQETAVSNVVLLAHGRKGPAEYARAPEQYRYCLTPAMDRIINGGTP